MAPPSSRPITQSDSLDLRLKDILSQLLYARFAYTETGFLLCCLTNLPGYTYKLEIYLKSQIMPGMAYCVGVLLWEETSAVLSAVRFALRDMMRLVMKRFIFLLLAYKLCSRGNCS